MGDQKNWFKKNRKISVDNYKVSKVKLFREKISASLSREINITVFFLFIVILLMISSAYAIFSSVQKSNKYNTITVGTLKIDFIENEDGLSNIIKLNESFPESDSKGQKKQPYSFKIKNSGSLKAEYKIKIMDDTDIISEDNCSTMLLDKNRIKVSINGGTPFILNSVSSKDYIIATGKLAPNKTNEFNIRVWIDENSGNEVLGKHYHGKIVVEAIDTKNMPNNDSILGAYQFNENNCITGEEPTCVETFCYTDKSANSCAPGTIIKYEINESERRYFYVLHDDGEVITMQDTNNTISETEWSLTGDNKSGPVTVLSKLEDATKNWYFVNTLEYEVGNESIGGSIYTGCKYDEIENKIICNRSTYAVDTLGKRKAKSRLITANEAVVLGCNNEISYSCPKFLSNGLVRDSKNEGYWTMSSCITYENSSYVIDKDSYLLADVVTSHRFGARAVVEIDK